MPNTINTNIAAYAAQSNIRTAGDAAASSVSRLSSGNRIVKASDDVAALAAGTLLRSTVSTLKAAQINTALGSSLLQVADGGLSQINEILQRQKFLASSATAGSLSSNERALLNQEFQGLSAEIDRLASNTKFNQVSLLSGALSGSVALSTKSQDGTATAGASAAAVVTVAVQPAAGDSVTINGYRVEFSTAAPGTTAAAGKVSVSATITETARNLVAFLNSSRDSRVANFRFTNVGGAVSANYAGGLLSGAYIVDATSSNTTNITVGSVANRTIATTNPIDGLGVDRTQALGTTTGTIFVNGGLLAANSGTAISTRAIINNKDFVGKFDGETIGKITATYTGVADTAVFSVTVGNFTYTTAAQDITNAGLVTLTFTGQNNTTLAPGGGTFTLDIAGGAISAFSAQAALDPQVQQMNDSLQGLTITQNRDVSSFKEGAIVTNAGVEVANLNGFSANFRSDDFANVNIESIKVSAPELGSTDAKITVVINGETFVSTSGIGNLIGLNTTIGLQSLTTPTNSLTLVTGNQAIATSATTTLDISTQVNADNIQAALEEAFGLTEAGAKLSFQVGTTSADSIGVQIDSAGTDNLFSGQSLDILDVTNASNAANVLDTAIDTLVSLRANVGALQSRFNYAAANIDSSIQNTDAARSVLLDTDVAAESTNYATQQVKLQAGISVLAQANQQLQALLKLLG
jgi:flagellin